MNTPRTSRMCDRSRSLRTAAPSTVTSKSGGPTTRSARIASVARGQVGLAVSRPRGGLGTPLLEPDPCRVEEERDRHREDRQRGGEADPDIGEDAQGATHAGIVARGGLFLFEGLGLLPPADHRQLGRRFALQLASPRGRSAPGSPRGTRSRMSRNPRCRTGSAADDRRDRSSRGSASAPRRAIRGRRSSSRDLVGKVLATGRRLRALQQQARRECALLLERGEMGRLDAGQFVDRRHDRIIDQRRAVARTAWARPAPPPRRLR